MRGIEISKSFLTFLFFFVLINPLVPIDLNVLILFGVFDESGPEGCELILFGQGEEQIESCFGPFGLLFGDFTEEFQSEAVLLGVGFTFEGN